MAGLTLEAGNKAFGGTLSRTDIPVYQIPRFLPRPVPTSLKDRQERLSYRFIGSSLDLTTALTYYRSAFIKFLFRLSFWQESVPHGLARSALSVHPQC